MEKEKQDEFEELARKIIKFLNDNFHPHAYALISTDSAEILEGKMGITTDDYLPG